MANEHLESEAAEHYLDTFRLRGDTVRCPESLDGTQDRDGPESTDPSQTGQDQGDRVAHDESVQNGNSKWIMGIVGGCLVGVIVAAVAGYGHLVTSQAQLETKVEQLRSDYRELRSETREDRQRISTALEQLRIEIISGGLTRSPARERERER